jgi:hypothetical protein
MPIRGTFFGCCASADNPIAKIKTHKAKQNVFLPIALCHKRMFI